MSFFTEDERMKYRNILKAAYPHSQSWAARVDQMRDSQLLAIGTRMKRTKTADILAVYKVGTGTKAPRIYDFRKRFICPSCDCEFVADVGYYVNEPLEPYGEFVSWALCPECCTPTWEIPKVFEE